MVGGSGERMVEGGLKGLVSGGPVKQDIGISCEVLDTFLVSHPSFLQPHL